MNPDIFNKALDACVEYRKQLDDKTNEVARLREENETLNRQVAFLQSEYSNATCKWLKAQKIVDDARLAPAPEEPVSEGTRIAAEARSACNDLTEEERKRYGALAEDVIKLHRPDKELSPALEEAAERELAETTNEVSRLRKYVEKLEIYSPENEWSQPEWRKLIGSKEEQEDPETLFKVYQFRFEPDIRGETNVAARLRESLDRYEDIINKQDDELIRLREENSELKQGKVFVDPKWIYNLETQLAKAHEELCQAGLREYGN